MRKLVEFPRLKRFLERTSAAAERNRDTVRRYGIIGLFVFVWFPFWMTGPVVGSAIGYLLGFPARLTLSVVLAGTYIAMVAWAYLLFGLHTRAAVFGPWAPALIIGLAIFFILAGYWLNRQGKDLSTRTGRVNAFSASFLNSSAVYAARTLTRTS